MLPADCIVLAFTELADDVVPSEDMAGAVVDEDVVTFVVPVPVEVAASVKVPRAFIDVAAGLLVPDVDIPAEADDVSALILDEADPDPVVFPVVSQPVTNRKAAATIACVIFIKNDFRFKMISYKKSRTMPESCTLRISSK